MKTLFLQLVLASLCVICLMNLQGCEPYKEKPAPCSVPVNPPALGKKVKEMDLYVCTDRDGNPIEPDNLILQFPAGLSPDSIAALKAAYGPAEVDSCICDPRLQMWRWESSPTLNIEETVSQLKADPRREGFGYSVLLNFVVHAFDPPKSQSAPIVIPDTQIAISRPGTLIAVLDTGLDTTFINRNQLHMHQMDQCAEVKGMGGWNFVSDNGDIDDDNGHGTAVTGVIAASLYKAAISNVYHCGASFLILKTLDHDGTGNMFDAICAINLAKVQGARIVNLSWGYYDVDDDFFREEVIGAPGSNGNLPVFVTSMGNDSLKNVGRNIHYPSTYSHNMAHVIAVGGDQRQTCWEDLQVRNTSPAPLAAFSNFDAEVTMTSAAIRVMAWDTLSTSSDLYHSEVMGTSFAAAFVSAQTAMALCCHTNLRSNTVRAALAGTIPASYAPGALGPRLKNLVIDQNALCVTNMPSPERRE
jgi:hypothetical protein